MGRDLPFKAGIADVPKIIEPLSFQYAGNDQGGAGIAADATAPEANKKKSTKSSHTRAIITAFVGDTTPSYEAEAAKLAWERNLDFFAKNLQ